MLLPLKPRLDFGGIPFDPPVSEFTLTWLKGNFLPAVRTRRDTVINAVSAANKRIDAERERIAKAAPATGQRLTNGNILNDPRLEQAARTIADHQIIDAIRVIKAESDATCIPALKYLERAVLTGKVLEERIFDKFSCLARVNAGFKNGDEMAFRANCKTLVEGAEPITLHRLAQAAIDCGAPEDIMLLTAILNENIKLPKDRRAFLNQTLLELLEPEEWTASSALLAQIVDLHKEAGAADARLAGHVGQASLMRISRGLAAVRLDKDGIPLAGDEE
jgi:hypothetical protein